MAARRIAGLALLVAGLAAVEALTPLETGLFESPAHAIIGRPMTPISYAGVARRTTYRAVAVAPVAWGAAAVGTAAVVGTAAAVSTATVAEQSQPTEVINYQQAPPPPSSAPRGQAIVIPPAQPGTTTTTTITTTTEPNPN